MYARRRFCNVPPVDLSYENDDLIEHIHAQYIEHMLPIYEAPPTMNYREPETQESIRKLLRAGCLEIIFKKVDGSIRKMRCTLHPDFLKSYSPPTYHKPNDNSDDEDPFIEETREQKKATVLSVWDLEKEGWRSIRWNSIQQFSSF